MGVSTEVDRRPHSPRLARAIMHLAASPFPLYQDDMSSGSASLWPIPCQLQSSSPKSGSLSPYATISPSGLGDKVADYCHQYREEGNIAQETEGQTSRQVSLQRYLEKRKDRGRFKSRKKIGFCSTPMEVYLNQQVRAQAPNGQSSRSRTSSPTQPGPPHALCGSADNQAKNASLLVDLNDNVLISILPKGLSLT
ncbi:CO/COL/TOC1, conserved site [Dillenia turbinata]|uniref:CO/COL/TOC1, conserved site n=1 Tax=Dillenia turbinata TaxID=194707 RepID=A0AAN8UHA0_9MAGN